MGSGRPLGLSRSSPSCLNRPAQRTDFVHGLIAGFIEDGTRNMSAAIAGSRGQIKRVREYRTRLIADVVAGKLDVREEAAGLPDVDALAAEDEAEDAAAGGAVTDEERLEAGREGAVA